jgi:hypothetical protein
MSYNGSGTFQINSTGQPVVGGTIISSSTFNALTADLATGLTTAITKDGQTTATARIPFAQGITSTLVTDASSTTTGSIITAGGVGIAKKLYVGTDANIAGTLTVTGVSTYSNLTASSAVATDASKNLVSVTNTGTGSNVLATSPTIASLNLTTALTLAGAAGNSGQVLTSAGSGLPTWVTPAGGFTLATPINSTSGTSISFTGIPAGVKHFIVNFSNVSGDGTGALRIQLGTSGGLYGSGAASVGGDITGAGNSLSQATGFFNLSQSTTAATFADGSIIFTMLNSSTNLWCSNGNLSKTETVGLYLSAGSQALPGVLTQLRITFSDGSNFDSGSINIAYM